MFMTKPSTRNITKKFSHFRLLYLARADPSDEGVVVPNPARHPLQHLHIVDTVLLNNPSRLLKIEHLEGSGRLRYVGVEPEDRAPNVTAPKPNIPYDRQLLIAHSPPLATGRRWAVPNPSGSSIITPAGGIEPPTNGLTGRCSTAELHRNFQLNTNERTAKIKIMGRDIALII